MKLFDSLVRRRLLLLPQLSVLFIATSLYAKYPLLIYYGVSYDITYFERFDTVVLDPDLYRDVHALRTRSFAYLSLGEVSSGRQYYKKLKDSGLLAGKNGDWGSHYIRAEDPRWRALLLNEIIPLIMRRGYKGLFLDTVDSLLYRKVPSAEIITLIKEIKKRYPSLKLMLNRGFEIVDMVPVDALLYESTISGYNFTTKKSYLFTYDFRFRPKKKIELFSVDYWDQSDKRGIESIYHIALKKGYKPLVTDISLNEMPSVQWEMVHGSFKYDE